MTSGKKKKDKDIKEDIKELEEDIDDEIEAEEDMSRDFVMIGALIFIVVIFVAGVITIKYFPGINNPQKTDTVVQNSLSYNGFDFTKIDDTWYTNIVVNWQGKKLSYNPGFHYSPAETENISIDRNAGTVLKLSGDQVVYISVDPELNSKSVIAGTEISKVLGKIFFITVKSAVSKNTDNPNIPVVTCENVSDKTKVVMLRKGDTTQVLRDNTGCIIVEGTDEDEIIRAADRLSYNLLGVDKKKIVVS
ncbi:hypothetical protein GF327_02130 [Candidatus Woesearchaeota archaeon]|nr:hypothetical protein [Candidatus Woesearchaeota archaeon]